jgi:hypothetical protein
MINIRKRGILNISKRGQITIFIITGILILLAIAAFVFLRQTVTVFKPEKVIPPEVQPVQNFIDNCLQESAREAVILMASNGGYLTFPAEIDLDPFSYITTGPVSDVRLPLWRYNGLIRIPSEERMKDDLALYILNNVKNCINDLNSFKEQFEIQKGNMSVNIDLQDDKVLVEMVYPLTISLKEINQTTKIDSFNSEVNLRLKAMYELATKIMEEENIDLFVEETTIDLLALDPDIPYTDIEFTCKQKTWRIADVRNRIRYLLSADLPLIRIDKTSYRPVPDDRPYEQSHYIWDVTKLIYPNTRVTISYDNQFPFDLRISPNEGNVLLKSNSQQGQDMLSALCINLWHFTYDIKYPVLVTIRDEAASGHDELIFNFGFQVGINHNAADRSNFAIAPATFVQGETSEDFCSNSAIKKILNVHTFENVSTHDYGDLIDELIGVNVSFTCMRLKCDMGESRWAFMGAVSRVSKEVPYCANAVVRGTKEDFLPAQDFVTTNKEKTVSLYLTPVIKKNVSVFKHYKYSLDRTEALDQNENAVVTIEKDNYKASAMYPPVEGLSELQLLAKWDHKYKLSIYLADDQGVTGGYKADWTPSWQELRDASRIEFHVFEYPYTTDEEKTYQNMAGLEEDSKVIPGPVLVKG